MTRIQLKKEAGQSPDRKKARQNREKVPCVIACRLWDPILFFVTNAPDFATMNRENASPNLTTFQEAK
ncbi:MAG: hypothetical protein LUE17_16960 [Planctomycetaceae bacterium]|nr:hypothetical protein [Planctomycetaceae bacterium]